MPKSTKNTSLADGPVVHLKKLIRGRTKAMPELPQRETTQWKDFCLSDHLSSTKSNPHHGSNFGRANG
jgi:hypothetical protein